MKNFIISMKLYIWAIALFVLALGLRFLLLPLEAGLPYITLYPGLVICALLCGWRPTLLYIPLAAITSTYIFKSPHYGFGAGDIVPIAAFTVATLVMLAVIELYKRREISHQLIEELRIPKGGKLGRWMWLTLVMLLLMGAAGIQQNFKVIEDAAWVAHTCRIDSRIESLQSNLNDAETGMRGYLITGDSAFLEPYRGADQRVASDLQTLNALTADNPLQQDRLRQLAPLLKQRLDKLAYNIALRLDQGFAKTQASVQTGTGKHLHDQIRAVLADMQATEHDLALERETTAKTSAALSRAVSMLSLACALTLIAYILWQLSRQLHERRIAEDKVRLLNAQLAAHTGNLEVRLQLATRASGIGFWDWDLRGKEVYFSPGYKAMLGYAEHELAHRFEEWQSRVHPEDIAEALQRVQIYLAAPAGEFTSEFRMRHRDGSYRWILANAQAMLDDKGKPYRMLGSHIDITERKLIALQILHDQLNKDAIFNSTQDLIWSIDSDFKLIEANQAFINSIKNFSGVVLQRGEGILRQDIFSPELIAFWKGLYKNSLAGNSSINEFKTPSTNELAESWLELNLNPIRDGDKITGVACFGRVITERKVAEAALNESQEMLQLALGAAHIGHWDLNLVTKKATRSLQHGQIFGYTEPLPEWGFKIFLEHVHPDDRSWVEQSFQLSLKSYTEWNEEFRILRTDQALRWIWAHGQIFKSEAGEATRMVGIVSDITERKLLELAILASEEKYKILFHQANLPTAITRLADFKIAEINDAFVNAFGYSRDEVIGKTSLEIGLVRDSVKREKVLSAIKSSKEANHSELTFYTKSGKALTVLINNHRLFISGQEFILSTMQDITEQRKLQDSLIRSEKEFRSLAESMPQIVWVTTADGATNYLNHQWVEYTGLTLEESYGDGWTKPFHPDDQQAAWAAWQNAVNNRGVYRLECRLRRADGAYRWWLIRGVPLLDAEGNIEKWYGTCTDIDDIKQNENALREKNNEIERFTYMISHDLKSPLVTIRTFLSYLQQDLNNTDTKRVTEDIGYMTNASNKMSRMLDELLEFSRLVRLPAQKVTLNWHEIVKEAEMLVAGAIAQNAVQVEIAEASVELLADRTRLVQLWQNLIDNAVKFSGSQAAPQIRIGVEGQGRDRVFYVCDNGIGIEPRYHEKIFGLFERLDVSTPGSGLGLALVKRIVEQYGGDIHVDSAGPGNGTCFRFTLPEAYKA